MAQGKEEEVAKLKKKSNQNKNDSDKMHAKLIKGCMKIAQHCVIELVHDGHDDEAAAEQTVQRRGHDDDEHDHQKRQKR